MSGNATNEIILAKINDILVDFNELNRQINNFPEKFSGKIDAINFAIKQTPDALEESLKKLFSAAEELEKTVQESTDECRVSMRAYAINELDNLKVKISEAINESIKNSIDMPLDQAKERIIQINKMLQKSTGVEMSTRVAFGIGGLLGLSFLSLAMCISAGYLYFQERSKAERYYNAFREQQIVIERLPEETQRQFRDELGRYLARNQK
ncbi:TPA: hypothetical protein ACHKBA_004626 [Escherichia coli]|jgi:uncharacterized protein Smg (DUF494 family)|uniref:Uncharacterized protein n=1 Tax=Escherichia coli TaxID=562 RepID=A0ABD4PF49_ECOLX|nr:hypothetical protein [Escherichia coli]HBC3203135.1 hypothetical protein [Escherichia coli O146]EEQ1522959.1 hypothetical protein [Escherichia coli]EEQ3615052.1 hypothetical protein [Escherichia coli]EEQ5788669.1 hypothetical protein [Escherichia coli]EEQ9176723.1 hypothetical protein [Escherichia coli]